MRTAPKRILYAFCFCVGLILGFQVLLGKLLDGACFFMAIGSAIMPKFGLEVDL